MKKRVNIIVSALLICSIILGQSVNSFSYGEKAKGKIPEILPKRLMVGLCEENGSTWMKNSGVKWDLRYRYLTKGWTDNWGWGKRDGTFALDYFKECSSQGLIPAVTYYVLNGEPGGGEDDFYKKTTSASTMADYWSDFKLLMQKVKEYGKPVMVLLEPDGFAYMEMQSKENPNAYSAVAASKVPELAGLPNTAAGWGMAFLQLRKSVGAKNAILGVHVSAWASTKDIAYYSVTDPLQPEVDKVYKFLAPLGLGQNQTGDSFDVLVGDPLDRDSDFHKIVNGQDRWWNADDSASISSKSFNRYAEWLRLFNIKAQKRWVLWQIPLGNSNNLNVYNNGKPREGYKDNRAEYFFGKNSTQHLSKFADSGVIALLFGAGAGGQASYTNDYYTDGKLFMKSRAGAFLNAGGMTLEGEAQNGQKEKKAAKAIELEIGNKYMMADGISQEVDPGRETAPIIINKRTMVPIRSIVEAFGGKVTYEERQRKITITYNGKVLELFVDNNVITINGAEKTIDTAPMIINARTLVPVRFIAEGLGLNVNWDDKSRKILIKF